MNYISDRIAENYLMLSGIQHFSFCKRQWALIYIEQLWNNNVLTIGGKILHERVNDPFLTERNNIILTSRSVPIISHTLKLYGIADVIEYLKSDKGIRITGNEGLWIPYPIEYKHGGPKPTNCDLVQLCAQVICLEETYKIKLNKGAIYYYKIRKRVEIEITDSLRQETIELAKEMHELFEQGKTPKAEYKKSCLSCSLYDLCLPEYAKNNISVDQYVLNNIE